MRANGGKCGDLVPRIRSNAEKNHLVEARAVPLDTAFRIHRPGEDGCGADPERFRAKRSAAIDYRYKYVN